MKNILKLQIALAIILITFSACGIDEFVYLYPVTNLVFNPTSSDDAQNKYFSFTTSDQENKAESGDYFKGFEIFYRIYTSEAIKNADVIEITNYNTSNPTIISSYLVSTKKYRRLVQVIDNDMTRLAPPALIPAADTNRTIVIRLHSIGTEYPAIFKIDGVEQTKIKRKINESKAENFILSEININDEDVSHSGSETVITKCYVQAFVLAYGYDKSYKPLYSSAFNIGAITIAE